MTEVNLAIRSICALHRAQSLSNIPPSRIELESSPYVSGYKKFDLDMRRKAEILKYQNAALKTNSFTKKQQFSRLVKGQVAPISTSFITKHSIVNAANDQKVVKCPDGNVVLTNPSASGVPPDPNVPFLYNDETVPLYHFVDPKTTRAYGIINPL